MSEHIEVPHQVHETVVHLIIDDGHYSGLTENQRVRVRKYLEANGIDPNDVSGHDPLSVRTVHFPIGGDAIYIEFTQYHRVGGHVQCNERPFGPVKFPRRVRQRVPFGAPC